MLTLLALLPLVSAQPTPPAPVEPVAVPELPELPVPPVVPTPPSPSPTRMMADQRVTVTGPSNDLFVMARLSPCKGRSTTTRS